MGHLRRCITIAIPVLLVYDHRSVLLLVDRKTCAPKYGYHFQSQLCLDQYPKKVLNLTLVIIFL
jgi:hypothetical protein